MLGSPLIYIFPGNSFYGFFLIYRNKTANTAYSPITIAKVPIRSTLPPSAIITGPNPKKVTKINPIIIIKE